MRAHDLPLGSWVCDIQLYANAAFMGLSIFDLPSRQSDSETQLWQPLMDWIKGGWPDIS